ncbi:hypothetical protein DFH06DRAFT_1211065 [Mycena polygramma]|nr:hypothetical protein DFH06DRAFT_1211065 [Mycena polygramma]
MAAQKISERFCAPDADITISSSDGVLFKVHRKNLEVHSDIFADAANAARPDNVGEEVPQPNLQLVDFETFAGVAEAAEKYVVYSALTLCQMRMKDSIISHPLEVLRYAVKHDHVDLANESAQQSMSCEVAKAMEVLPLDNFKSWVRH